MKGEKKTEAGETVSKVIEKVIIIDQVNVDADISYKLIGQQKTYTKTKKLKGKKKK